MIIFPRKRSLERAQARHLNVQRRFHAVNFELMERRIVSYLRQRLPDAYVRSTCFCQTFSTRLSVYDRPSDVSALPVNRYVL